MKFYLSGTTKSTRHGGKLVVDAAIERRCPRLFTFAYAKEAIEELDYWTASGVRGDIMIDCGAFSAWNKGMQIRNEDVIAWDKHLLAKYGAHHDFTFVALDVIPGKRGVAPVAEDVVLGMQQSLQNYLDMRAALDAPVVPIFHTGEPASYRDELLGHTNWIGFGLSQNLSENQRVQFAEQYFVPGSKVHGMAATGQRMMACAPWFSVDSATWVMVAALGGILWNTAKGMKGISLSSTSPALKKLDGHLDNMSEGPFIRQEIERRGYSVQELADDYVKRWVWNVHAVADCYRPSVPLLQQGLFDA